MMGSGTPRSQRSAPRPNPIVISSVRVSRHWENARVARRVPGKRKRRAVRGVFNRSEIESRLAHLDDEIHQMRVASEKEGAADEERIKASAAEEARRISESASQRGSGD